MLVLALSMFSTTAFAAQDDNYHDSAGHWLSAMNRTNELDVNATVTHETGNCVVCKQSTTFIIYRTSEYTRHGEAALTRKDAFYMGYYWTKACCGTCGTMNSNMGIGDYCFSKNV